MTPPTPAFDPLPDYREYPVAENERPVMLVVTGYPAPDARVPRLHRKPLGEIARSR